MVRLTQATTQPGGDYSGLADTGTLVRPSWLLAGIGLVVLGLALVRRRRGEARDG